MVLFFNVNINSNTQIQRLSMPQETDISTLQTSELLKNHSFCKDIQNFTNHKKIFSLYPLPVQGVKHYISGM